MRSHQLRATYSGRTTKVIGAGLSGGHAPSGPTAWAPSGQTRAPYGDSTTTRGTPGTWRCHRSRSSTAASWSSVMNTAVTCSEIERATLTAWTAARFSSGIGTIARSSRVGGATTYDRLIASWRADCTYWRRMNSIIPTRSGIRMTTTKAPPENFSVTTMARTTAVSRAPNALTAPRHRQPAARVRNQWRTMPPWDSVKHTNTPTEYSGISLVVWPWNRTYSRAAIPARRMIPQL